MTTLAQKLQEAFAARCHKLRYSSEEFARRIACRQTNASGWRLSVYRCPHCHGFHLTKRPQFPQGRPSQLAVTR